MGRRGDRDDLVLTELDGLLGVADEGSDVGSEEVLAVTQADDQRAVAAGGHDSVRLVGVHREEGEGTLEAVDDRAHRLGEVTGLREGRGQQLGSHLGVGLGGEADALREQLLLELVEVLDDAVVDHGELAVGPTAVRVRVLVGRATVRGPAGVPDAGRGRGDLLSLEGRPEVLQLARSLLGEDLVTGDERDARGVISAVLKAREAFHDNVQGTGTRVGPDVSNDSAHERQAIRRGTLC